MGYTSITSLGTQWYRCDKFPRRVEPPSKLEKLQEGEILGRGESARKSEAEILMLVVRTLRREVRSNERSHDLDASWLH